MFFNLLVWPKELIWWKNVFALRDYWIRYNIWLTSHPIKLIEIVSNCSFSLSDLSRTKFSKSFNWFITLQEYFFPLEFKLCSDWVLRKKNPKKKMLKKIQLNLTILRTMIIIISNAFFLLKFFVLRDRDSLNFSQERKCVLKLYLNNVQRNIIVITSL